MTLLPAAIPSPSTNVVHVGPFTVHVYGLCYVLAVLAAVAITRRRWGARGGSPELVYDVALWAVPAGIVGGRLYFLATPPGDSFEHWWGPLAYELLWNLALAAALVWLDRHRSIRPPGLFAFTSPVTAPSGLSRSCFALTRPRTYSGCAGTWCWRSPAP